MNRHRLLPLLLVVLTCGVTIADADRRVIEIVRQKDGTPVSEATVSLYRPSEIRHGAAPYYERCGKAGPLRTDARGRVRATVPGNAVAIIQADGLGSQIVACYHQPSPVRLAPGRVLKGRVVDAKTGKPIADANLTAFEPVSSIADVGGHRHFATIGPIRSKGRTNAAGRFSLSDGARPMLLRVSAAGRATRWQGTRSSVKGPIIQAEVRLERAGYLRGRVLSIEGKPVAGVDVFAHVAMSRGDERLLLHPGMALVEGATATMFQDANAGYRVIGATRVRTDKDGRFRFDALVLGSSHVIWAKTDDGLLITPLASALPEGAEGLGDEIRLQLQAVSAIQVLVKTGEGTSVTAALVQIRRSERNTWTRHRRCGSDGRARFERVAPDHYDLIVRDARDPKAMVRRRVRAVSGETVEVTVRLTEKKK